jgi:hypothetical protein
LNAFGQENCKNNKILHRSKNYRGFHEVQQHTICHSITKKNGPEGQIPAELQIPPYCDMPGGA